MLSLTEALLGCIQDISISKIDITEKFKLSEEEITYVT